MRISYCTIGTVGTLTYSLWALVYGSIIMSNSGNISRQAGSELDIAKSRYKFVDDLYTGNITRYAAANSTIDDAGCYVRSYENFIPALNAFCTPATEIANSQSTLEQHYNVKFINKPTEVQQSTRRDWEWEYYKEWDSCASKNSKGECSGGYVQKSRKHYYTVYIYITSTYGTLYEGSGTRIAMGCNSFDQSITLRTETYHASTTDVVRQKYLESETKHYSSKFIIDVKNDDIARTVEKGLDTGTTSYELAARNTLNEIEQQCIAFNRTLKDPMVYMQTISETVALIEKIRTDINTSLEFRDKSALYRDEKQKKFDDVDAIYLYDLSVWLPVFFVPSIILCCCLCICVDDLAKNHIDTGDCCEPSSSESQDTPAIPAIPVAAEVAYSTRRMLGSARNMMLNSYRRNNGTANAPVEAIAEPDPEVGSNMDQNRLALA